MTIKEANIKIKQIENDLVLLEDSNDSKKKKKIDNLFKEKEKLEKWVSKELHIIGEYEPLKAKIISLRQKSHLTWDAISEATNYSKRQCINIYKEYTEKRFDEIEKRNK